MANLLPTHYHASRSTVTMRTFSFSKKKKCFPSFHERKHKMWYIHLFSGILSVKGGNSNTCYNMNEPWKHHVKWNKPGLKGQISYKVPKIGKFIEMESRMVTPGAGRRGDELLSNELLVSVLDGGKVLEMDGGNGCTTLKWTVCVFESHFIEVRLTYKKLHIFTVHNLMSLEKYTP